MLSQKTKYALRALILLAERDPDELVTIVDIAEQENIPRKFLEAILVELRKAGLLYAKRGKSGGYRLARLPEEITYAEVMRLLDGHIAPLPCASRFFYKPCDDCPDPETCSTRWVMTRVRDAMSDVLDHTTLADVVQHRAANREFIPDYTI